MYSLDLMFISLLITALQSGNFKMTSFRTTQVFVTNIRTQNLIHFQSYFLPKEHYGNPRVRRGFREREKSHEVNKAG